MEIPTMRDMMQTKEKLQTPEIRVWCHPEKIDKIGDDYFKTFISFEEAIRFIKTHDEAEKAPLIAFKGYEINIFDIDEYKGN